MIVKILNEVGKKKSWGLYDNVEQISYGSATDEQLKGVKKEQLEGAWTSVTFKIKSVWHNIIGPTGNIYILNNEGKTIERI